MQIVQGILRIWNYSCNRSICNCQRCGCHS